MRVPRIAGAWAERILGAVQGVVRAGGEWMVYWALPRPNVCVR